MAKTLGKLKKVSTGEFWSQDPEGFATWLAHTDILEMLGDSIDVELDSVSGEASPGKLKGVVLATRADDEGRVLIKGQLEKTSSGDLGRLLIYAAGLDVKVVIWIGNNISEEHTRVLSWLNRITGDSIRFYAVEMELWQIDDSAPAPKFSVALEPPVTEKDDKFDLPPQEVAKTDGNHEASSSERIIEPPKPQPVVKDQPVPPPVQKGKGQGKDALSVKQNFVYTKTFR